MDDRDRDEQGQYQPEYSDAEIISAVRKHEPTGTNDIANELGIARQSADYRLRRLEEQGKLTVNKVGGALIWTVD